MTWASLSAKTRQITNTDNETRKARIKTLLVLATQVQTRLLGRTFTKGVLGDGSSSGNFISKCDDRALRDGVDEGHERENRCVRSRGMMCGAKIPIYFDNNYINTAMKVREYNKGR